MASEPATSDPRTTLAWSPRASPLAASAVAATGDAAVALGRRLAAHDDDALAALTAVAGRDLLVVLGAAASLPWVDGVVYLGRDPAAPELLLPTNLAPTIPVAILARAVRARLAASIAPPIAVLPGPPRLVPCGAARSIDRDRLAAWLAEHAAPAGARGAAAS